MNADITQLTNWWKETEQLCLELGSCDETLALLTERLTEFGGAYRDFLVVFRATYAELSQVYTRRMFYEDLADIMHATIGILFICIDVNKEFDVANAVFNVPQMYDDRAGSVLEAKGYLERAISSQVKRDTKQTLYHLDKCLMTLRQVQTSFDDLHRFSQAQVRNRAIKRVAKYLVYSLVLSGLLWLFINAIAKGYAIYFMPIFPGIALMIAAWDWKQDVHGLEVPGLFRERCVDLQGTVIARFRFISLLRPEEF